MKETASLQLWRCAPGPALTPGFEKEQDQDDNESSSSTDSDTGYSEEDLDRPPLEPRVVVVRAASSRPRSRPPQQDVGSRRAHSEPRPTPAPRPLRPEACPSRRAPQPPSRNKRAPRPPLQADQVPHHGQPVRPNTPRTRRLQATEDSQRGRSRQHRVIRPDQPPIPLSPATFRFLN